MAPTPEGTDRGSTTRTPRWVKVFGLVALVLILLVVIIQLFGIGGPHGPRRHIPPGDLGGRTPPTAQGVHQA